MEKKTTSLFQSYNLFQGYGSFSAQLVVRPPSNLKVFRLTIFVSPDPDSGSGGAAYISNQQMYTYQDGIKLSCAQVFTVANAVPPAVNIGTTDLETTKLVLDRRGIGYMQDNFYVSGKCMINFVWEGEIS